MAAITGLTSPSLPSQIGRTDLSALLARLLPLWLVSVATAQDAGSFGFDTVRGRAEKLAQAEYVPPKADDLPEWLAKLDFDGYRRIRFRDETALWSGDGLPFRLEFSHRGYLFQHRVPIHVVTRSGVRDLSFSPKQYQYGMDSPGEVPADLGYSGLSVLYPLGDNAAWNEVASFRGASFFRLIGSGQRYGASARGLAVGTASPKGEEFPEFVEFWVERPEPRATSLTIFGLLDSLSTTGAFRIVLTPGTQTLAEVQASLYPRRSIAKLGLGPLSSMFLYGEQRRRWVPDFRPEVHDSDGLLIADAGGGWTWRPLGNPKETHRISVFSLDDPTGFGLLQRDRAFTSYADLESRYETRPSYWVAPRGKWGKGRLELVEIPSDSEGNDNITCYWVPEKSPSPGQEFSFQYGLTAYLDDPSRPPLARAESTRTQNGKDAALFVLDFVGPQLGDDPAALRADVQATKGKIRNVVLCRNQVTGGMRCSFQLFEANAEACELRALLLRGDLQVSETWVLAWQPQ